MFTRFLLALLASAALLPAQRDWNDPFPPHRIADHLYYVGSKGLSTYLITTSKGHILINSSFERTVPLIRGSVEKLGYKFSDVKILLGSHAHNDHMEGNALVKELTGAQVYVMRGDDQVVADGGKGQYLYNATWKPCKVDRVLKDGDTVTLGEAVLTAHLTPGHTRGCTTWTMQGKDAGKTLDVVIVGSPNVNPGYVLVGNKKYPGIVRDYEKTFQVLKSLPVDVFLGAHGDYYGMPAKYEKLKAGGPNPFIDAAGYKAYIDNREAAFRKELAKQQAGGKL